MDFKFYNKKITGILTIFPANEFKFDDEIGNYNFPIKSSLKLKNMMGLDRHRIADENTCASDLCLFGLDLLINERLLNINEIDALIFVTQTPDHFIPPTSNIIQGKLGLQNDVFCLDINQGCAGFLVGLIQAFMLLDQDNIKKVVLLNGDTASKQVSKYDRNSFPLVSDAGSVTIVEKDPNQNVVFANVKMDGSRSNALHIPAGAYRMPHSSETSQLVNEGDGNLRSKENIHMDGAAIYNFTVNEVPPMIDKLLEFSNTTKKEIDYFMFHQPNKFILKTLAEKMNIDPIKMPNNIVENFGNPSSVSIPAVITLNLGDKLKTDSYKMCLAGFGVGLTWSSMLISLGNLDFCKIIDYK